MDTFTDAVFFNGLITTLDRMRPQAEAMAMLRDQAQRTAAPQWVRVIGGPSEFQFAEKRLPTLAEVNAAAAAACCAVPCGASPLVRRSQRAAGARPAIVLDGTRLRVRLLIRELQHE